MDEIFNETGEFWIIGNEESKFSGKLISNEHYFLESNLNSALKEDYKNVTTIIGKINGIYVTLYKTHLYNNSNNLGFMIEYIFKNYDFNQELSFKEIKFQFDKLNKWITDSAYVMNMNQVELSCEIQNKHVNLDNFSIDLLFDDILNKKTDNYLINFKILFYYNKFREFEDILKDIEILKNFFTLAIYSKINLIEITILIKDENNSQQEINIFSKHNISNNNVDYNWFDMIIQYHEIERNFGEILQNWFEKYSTFKPFFDIYFLNITSKLYAEALLITYIDSLEYFMSHNDLFDDKFMTPHDYEQIFNKFQTFIESLDIDDDHKTALKNTVEHGYSHTLRKRLKDLFKKLKDYEVLNEIISQYGKPKEFINIVVNTRNYYTHYGNKNQWVASGDKLLILDFTLRLILDLCILNELKLPKNYINNILRKKLTYSLKLLK